MSQSSIGEFQMPGRNVEFKTRLEEIDVVHARLAKSTSRPPIELFQDDTFFVVPRGRLKLRQFSPGSGELIAYERSDQGGVRVSEYLRAPTEQPDLLREVLSRSLELVGRVRKRRLVFLIDPNTWTWDTQAELQDRPTILDDHQLSRVHLDQVDGLGTFLELEVVLGPAVSESLGYRFASNFLTGLGIEPRQIIGQAYIDLLESHNSQLGTAENPGGFRPEAPTA